MKKFSKELVVMLQVLKQHFDSENKIFQYVCKDDRVAYGHELATNTLLETIEKMIQINEEKTTR
jgi:hypothetical protein